MINEILVPRDNANDEEVIVVSNIANGTNVISNKTVILELEGSKTVYEYRAETSGYYYSFVKEGDTVVFGQVFGIISDKELSIEQINTYQSKQKKSENSNLKNSVNSNQRITKPAQTLIDKYSIPLSFFLGKEVVSKEDCESYIKKNKKDTGNERPELGNSLERVAIIGAGTGGMIALDILIKTPHQTAISFYDDNLKGSKIYDIPVVDKIDINIIKEDYKLKKFDFVLVTLGSNISLRDKIYKLLKEENIPFTNAIHPSVNIAVGVNLGKSNVLAAGCVVGAFVNLGENNFISSACVIEHHNTLGRSNSFGPVVATSGNVKIGNTNRFGTGIFIEPFLEIGNTCIISSGSIITTNISNNSTVKLISNQRIT